MNEVHEIDCPVNEKRQAVYGEASPDMCRCVRMRRSMTHEEAEQAHADGLALGGGLNEYLDEQHRLGLTRSVDASKFISTRVEPDEMTITPDDDGLYLAVSKKTGELISRDGRPLFAIRAEWEKLSRSVPWSLLICTKVFGVPFGALPLVDYGNQPDIVGDLVKGLDMVTKLVEALTQRVTILDQVIGQIMREEAKG